MVHISKLEAAERNLGEAIRLFFEKRDSIAVHTLAAASQQVLRDIAKVSLPNYIGILHDHPSLREDCNSDWRRLLNEPRNFFKHADSDSSAELEFDEEMNEILLIDAVGILTQISNKPHAEAAIYAAWFELRYPLAAGAFPGNLSLSYCQYKNIRPDDFAEFSKLCQSQLGNK
jgi:hypothetical protein